MEYYKKMLWVVQEIVERVLQYTYVMYEATHYNTNHISYLESHIDKLDGNMSEKISLTDEVRK